MSDEYTTGSYRIELLKADNWMPWKRRMLAVFRDLGLDKYIERDAKAPESADVTKPTTRNSRRRRNGLMEIARHAPGSNSRSGMPR